MSDTILYGLVIYSIGCIVPTPLDPTPAPTNYAPVFVGASPGFGPIAHTTADQFDLQVTVDDPDVDQTGSQDDLHARLFFANGNQLIWDGEDISLMAASPPDPMHPTLRYGTFPSTFRCSLAPNQNGTNYLYAIVSDRKFDPNSPSMPLAGGHRDSNHWDLQCSM